MRILYIPSGFKRIYEYFDQSIIKGLTLLNHKVKSFNPLLGVTKLQVIIDSFRPDIVLTMVGVKMPTKTILKLINQQDIPAAIWLTEDPFYIDRTIPLVSNYDYVFTIDTAALEIYQKNGHEHCYYLPLAVDPQIYRPLSSYQKKYDICLVGYPYPDRVRLIKKLLEKTSNKILVVGTKWDQHLSGASSNRNLIIQSTWLSPETIVQYYNQSKIVLNTHRPYDLKENENSQGIINKSVNNRTFEIASCGVFQLIDDKADVTPHFNKETEIISFYSDEDLIKKVDYYLLHLEKRNEVAENSRIKAHKEHTFKQRLGKLMAIIQAEGNC